MGKLKYESDEAMEHRIAEIKSEISNLRRKRSEKYKETGDAIFRDRDASEIKLVADIRRIRNALSYRKKRREKYGCLSGEALLINNDK